jgi:hypothetical protein
MQPPTKHMIRISGMSTMPWGLINACKWDIEVKEEGRGNEWHSNNSIQGECLSVRVVERDNRCDVCLSVCV